MQGVSWQAAGGEVMTMDALIVLDHRHAAIDIIIIIVVLYILTALIYRQRIVDILSVDNNCERACMAYTSTMTMHIL